MIDTDMPPPDHPDVVSAQQLTANIMPYLKQRSLFVISCAFGWMIGQIVKNDTELYESIDNIKEAGEASLWAREDNGHV